MHREHRTITAYIAVTSIRIWHPQRLPAQHKCNGDGVYGYLFGLFFHYNAAHEGAWQMNGHQSSNILGERLCILAVTGFRRHAGAERLTNSTIVCVNLGLFTWLMAGLCVEAQLPPDRPWQGQETAGTGSRRYKMPPATGHEPVELPGCLCL